MVSCTTKRDSNSENNSEQVMVKDQLIVAKDSNEKKKIRHENRKSYFTAYFQGCGFCILEEDILSLEERIHCTNIISMNSRGEDQNL
jgi:hypothetical protein